MSEDGRLRTVGRERIKCLGQAFTAHPKVDPRTGEGSALHSDGYVEGVSMRYVVKAGRVMEVPVAPGHYSVAVQHVHVP